MGWLRLKIAVTALALPGHLAAATVDFDSGATAFARGEFTRAYSIWLEQAQAGDPDAQTVVAAMLESGTGIPGDTEEARRWYRYAARAGHPIAIHKYVVDWLTQPGPEPIAEVLHLLHSSAKEGNLVAQMDLAFLYDRGIGVQQDSAAAQRWYQRAARQGSLIAHFNLAHAEFDRTGDDISLDNAIQHLSIAANNGLAEASFLLARAYEEGRGVSKKSDEAAHYYRIAAEDGFAPAQNNLAVTLHQKEPSSVEPLALWREAAAGGLRAARVNLGLFYAQNDDIVNNNVLAYAWLTLAGRASLSSEEALLASRAQLYAADIWEGLSDEERLSAVILADTFLDLEHSGRIEDLLREDSRLASDRLHWELMNLMEVEVGRQEQIRKWLGRRGDPVPMNCLVMDPPPECPNYTPGWDGVTPQETQGDLFPMHCLVMDPPPPECPNYTPTSDFVPPQEARGNLVPTDCLVMDPPPPECPNATSWWEGYQPDAELVGMLKDFGEKRQRNPGTMSDEEIQQELRRILGEKSYNEWIEKTAEIVFDQGVKRVLEFVVHRAVVGAGALLLNSSTAEAPGPEFERKERIEALTKEWSRRQNQKDDERRRRDLEELEEIAQRNYAEWQRRRQEKEEARRRAEEEEARRRADDEMRQRDRQIENEIRLIDRITRETHPINDAPMEVIQRIGKIACAPKERRYG